MYNYQEASRPQSKPCTDMHRKYRKVWFCFHQIFSSLWKFKMGKWLRGCFSWVQYEKASLDSCAVPTICAQALPGGHRPPGSSPRVPADRGRCLWSPLASHQLPPKRISGCVYHSPATMSWCKTMFQLLPKCYPRDIYKDVSSVTSGRWRGRKLFYWYKVWYKLKPGYFLTWRADI